MRKIISRKANNITNRVCRDKQWYKMVKNTIHEKFLGKEERKLEEEQREMREERESKRSRLESFIFILLADPGTLECRG